VSKDYSSDSKLSENSPINDSGMPIQQIMQAGEGASQLLNSPIYNLAHRMSVDQTVQAWSSSAPKEREKREGHYQEIQALGRISMNMYSMVERAQQLIKEQGETQFKAQNEYLDQQGFGEPPNNSGNGQFQ
jgi:hypothetical protein